MNTSDIWFFNPPTSQSWEVVTKSKKQRNLQKKIDAHAERERLAKQLPKLEDILPSQQYDYLLHDPSNSYNSVELAKQSVSGAQKAVSTDKKSKSSSKWINSSRSQKENGRDKGNNRQQQVPKISAKPKNLEKLMKELSAEELQTEIEQACLRHPSSTISQLCAFASYFNQKLDVAVDPVFSGKSHLYPSQLLPKAVKDVLLNFLASIRETNLEHFFHYVLLENMITELLVDKSALGWKIIAQIIGQKWPQICGSNLANSAMLRNSYQNRQYIGLSLLWAVGQGGYQDLMVGLKVWQNIMYPCLELRNYSKFVVHYLERLTQLFESKPSLTFNQNEFISIYNNLKVPNTHLSVDLQQTLIHCANKLLRNFIQSTSKRSYIFLTLFRNIQDPETSHSELDECITCLGLDDYCYRIWKMNYKRQIVRSIYLLERIGTQIEADLSTIQYDALKQFLSEAKELNEELTQAKKPDPNLLTLKNVLQNVQDKANSQSRKKQNSGSGRNSRSKPGSSKCWMWLMVTTSLFAFLAGTLIYDTEVNGKGLFAKSYTGQTLQNAGALPFVERAWYTSMGSAARGYKWSEKNILPRLKRGGRLLTDLTKMAKVGTTNIYIALKEFMNSKLPVAANFLEKYIPGLPTQIEKSAESVKGFTLATGVKVAEFFKKQVLIGRFSPENLSKAMNETQKIALHYIQQFHKKVDAYSKLK